MGKIVSKILCHKDIWTWLDWRLPEVRSHVCSSSAIPQKLSTAWPPVHTQHFFQKEWKHVVHLGYCGMPELWNMVSALLNVDLWNMTHLHVMYCSNTTRHEPYTTEFMVLSLSVWQGHKKLLTTSRPGYTHMREVQWTFNGKWHHSLWGNQDVASDKIWGIRLL